MVYRTRIVFRKNNEGRSMLKGGGISKGGEGEKKVHLKITYK